MNRTLRSFAVYFLVVLGAVIAIQALVSSSSKPDQLSYSELTQEIEKGRVSEAWLEDDPNVVRFTLEGESGEFTTNYPGESEDELTALLGAKGVKLEIKHDTTTFLDVIIQLLPWLVIFGIMFFMIMQAQGGGNRVMSFGKAKARQVTRDQPKVTFKDVAGLDEAVEELGEIRDFLQNPQKFRQMGAKIPKGVLLYGPPGTGKTLLARAVAGEAGVPFFSISGSDFVEMFVGVGASRVRDLFDQAKAAAPSIVFIDEIDAVGRHRGAGLGGGHDEREQTLNQLLVEMDGFDPRQGVIIIAGTNRPDILDPALLRPGRFDRQIVVDRPDLKGRTRILEVHAKGKPIAEGVDLEVLARQTPGFTGADLANLINEAALLAARYNKEEITLVELEESITRVITGPERKSRLISDEEKRVTAYHEGGHALVGHALPNADPIHKISIIPRGRALGFTLALPTEDRYLIRRSELVDQLAMMLGGRTAEELVFSDPTTGASDDIEKATTLARKMVMEYGMSDRLGPMRYGQADGEVFLGRDYARHQDYSDQVAAHIDDEVRSLIAQAHQEAREILTRYRHVLDDLAQELVEKETIDAAEVAEIFATVKKWVHPISEPSQLQAPPGGRAAASAQELGRP